MLDGIKEEKANGKTNKIVILHCVCHCSKGLDGSVILSLPVITSFKTEKYDPSNLSSATNC